MSLKVFDQQAQVWVETDPHLWPFQAMVRKRVDSMPDCGCVDECRCKAGIEPRVNKSTIYHQLRKLGRWNKAGPARVAFARRLQANDAPKQKADELAWRLLEDMLWAAEGEAGFDLAVIDVELDAMLAYGEEQEYPERPSEAEIAAALAGAASVFVGENGTCRLPTTIVYFYQRLGLWDLASKYLRRDDPDGDEIENVSTSTAWRVLAHLLGGQEGVAAIADRLKRLLAAPSSQNSVKEDGRPGGRK